MNTLSKRLTFGTCGVVLLLLVLGFNAVSAQTATPMATPAFCTCGQTYQAEDWLDPNGPWTCGDAGPGGYQISRSGSPAAAPAEPEPSMISYVLGAIMAGGLLLGVVFPVRKRRKVNDG